MPEKKEPGQIAYEANALRIGSLKKYPFADQDEEVCRSWAAIEAAVLAANKPERAVGMWITDIHNNARRFVIVERTVDQVTCPASKDLMARYWVCFEGGGSVAVSVDDARKVVEALGGAWPEEQANG